MVTILQSQLALLKYFQHNILCKPKKLKYSYINYSSSLKGIILAILFIIEDISREQKEANLIIILLAN